MSQNSPKNLDNRGFCAIRTDFFVVKCKKTEKSHILSAISKKKIPTAVERNTIKRRIRTAFKPFLDKSVTVTVQPLAVTGRTPYSAYTEAADRLCKKCIQPLES